MGTPPTRVKTWAEDYDNAGRIPMTNYHLESVARTLVADGKGILAADETIRTLTRRFETLGIKSTEQSRRTYREMLFTSPGAAEFISGVIMYDETIRQKSSCGAPLVEALTAQSITPASRSIPVRSPLPALLEKRLPKVSTVYVIASRITVPSALVLRSGARSSVSQRLCQAPLA
jgi:hypothetical protein